MKWQGKSSWMHSGVLGTMIAISGVASVARGQEADSEVVTMVLELITNEDNALRGIGFEQIRSELPGEPTTLLFAQKITEIPAAAQPGLISALAERGDRAARPALLSILQKSTDSAVQVAAIQAMSKLGGVEDIDLLLDKLSSEDAAQQVAARQTLVKLRGADAPTAIAQKIPAAKPAVQLALLDVLVERRAASSVDTIQQLTLGSDAVLRAAAMQALGNLASAEHLPGMLQGVLKAERGKERDAAEKAVMFVCQRIEPAEERAAPLLAAFDKLSADEQDQLYSTLGRVGGAAILARIEPLLASQTAKQRDNGLRAICNWPDASVAPRLLELIQAEKDAKQRAMVLGALIRVAPLPDDRTPADRLELMKSVMNLCSKDSERNQVLKRVSAIRLVETLRYVLPYVDQPAFTEQACEAIVELAHHRNLREPNKAEFDQALDLVLAKSKNAVVQDRATRYKKGQTWYRNQQ